MVSNTGQTKRIRANKVKKAGRARKNAIVKKGTSKTNEELFKVVD